MKALVTELIAATEKLFPDWHGEVVLTPPAKKQFGDWSSPVALAIGRSVSKPPLEVANAIIGEIPASARYEVSVTPPGFVNFTFTSVGWSWILSELSEAGARFGRDNSYGDTKLLIEFISANPTGPMTLANGRGGFAGDALANAFRYLGATVEREYYVNDGGNQLVTLGQSVVARRKGEEWEGGYGGDYVSDLAREIDAEDPYEAGKEAGELVLTKWIKPTIKRMGIEYDYFASETKLVDDGLVQRALDLLEHQQLVYQAEDAWWLKTTEFGDDKDRVLVRRDGEFTYLMKDIAYHWHKMTRGYNRLITMVGPDHLAEARALALILEHVVRSAVGWQGRFDEPVFQSVRLMKDGQEFKMSKRAGTFVLLDELLDQVGVDVARFLFLMTDLRTHMDFDLEAAKATSEVNPVFYVQYAFVRCRSVLNKAVHTTTTKENSGLEWSEKETALLQQLSRWPEVVRSVVDDLAPHRLAHYAIELAKVFHQFYAAHRVIGSDAEALRLELVQATQTTLGQCLSVMGVSQPEQMLREE